MFDIQVILTSSLEDNAFGVSAIRYLNAVLQVLNIPPNPPSHLNSTAVLHGSHRRQLSTILNG